LWSADKRFQRPASFSAIIGLRKYLSPDEGAAEAKKAAAKEVELRSCLGLEYISGHSAEGRGRAGGQSDGAQLFKETGD
jgi:hypothetical protein